MGLDAVRYILTFSPLVLIIAIISKIKTNINKTPFFKNTQHLEHQYAASRTIDHQR